MAEIAERTEIVYDNVGELIQDEGLRKKMSKLLEHTEKLGMGVFLLPPGIHIEINDGVMDATVPYTLPIPLTDDTVYALAEFSSVLTDSMLYHSTMSSAHQNTALKDTFSLFMQRKNRRSITREYFLKAEEHAYSTTTLADFMRRARALKDGRVEVLCAEGIDDFLLQYTRGRTDFPFDPLLEPARLNPEGNLVGQWAIPVPSRWQVFVALVLYDEDEAKNNAEQK